MDTLKSCFCYFFSLQNSLIIFSFLFMPYIEGRDLVQILLTAGADPSAQDSHNGRTTLHTAAMTNDVDLVQVCGSPSCLK
jgi:ankyrin repeat protein